MSAVEGRLFYIPTNRRCDESLSAYLDEAAALAASQSVPVTFALVESADAPFVEGHGRLIAERRTRTGMRALHWTAARQHAFIARVLAAARVSGAESAGLQRLLFPPNPAYGAGPNKAALLAASLGADTLHRRDSDTVPPLHGGVPRYPSELEARYAGARLDDGRIVFFVGSDYTGDPPVDRFDLAGTSFELMVEHERIRHPEATQEELEQRVRRHSLVRPHATYERDEIEVDTSGKTEMGVSCCYRVFLELPEMPISATLGCDYLQKNLLYQLERPVLYHNRAVTHCHDSGRGASDEEFVRYNLMDARYKILWRIWSRHNAQLRAERTTLAAVPDGRVADMDAYVDSWERAVRATPRAELLEIVGALCRINRKAFALAPQNTKYARLADVLSASGEQLVGDVLQGIADYTTLIRAWPRLIDGARRTAVADGGEG